MSIANKPTWQVPAAERTPPGIGPLVSYYYDMARAGLPVDQLGPLHTGERFGWAYAGRMFHTQVLWGLYQYIPPHVEATARICTIEGGVLMFPMYDFCGGSVVSSAFVQPFNFANSPGDYVFRSFRPGASNSESKRAQERFALTTSSAFRARFAHIVPRMSEFTGKATHTQSEAEEFMRKSIGAALVSVSRSQRRAGLFAADRVAPMRCATRPIMETINGIVPYYSSLPMVTGWAGRVVHRYSPDPLPNTETRPGYPEVAACSARYSPGENYMNTNSGSTVSMCQVLLGEPQRAHFTTPSPLEINKFIHPDYIDMLPQAIFHN